MEGGKAGGEAVGRPSWEVSAERLPSGAEGN